MTPTPVSNTTKSIVSVTLGVILSIAVLVANFLAPTVLTGGLAGLIVTCIGVIAGAYNINIIQVQTAAVAASNQKLAVYSTLLSNAGIQHD